MIQIREVRSISFVVRLCLALPRSQYPWQVVHPRKEIDEVASWYGGPDDAFYEVREALDRWADWDAGPVGELDSCLTRRTDPIRQEKIANTKQGEEAYRLRCCSQSYGEERTSLTNHMALRCCIEQKASAAVGFTLSCAALRIDRHLPPLVSSRS